MNVVPQFQFEEPEKKSDSSTDTVAFARTSSKLLSAPLCRPEDLGRPLPNSPFAVSVVLPTWDSVVGYEKGLSSVVDALKSGYPRFVIKGFTEQLFNQLHQSHCQTGERLIGFPSFASADRCLNFVRQEFPGVGRLSSTEYSPIFACIVPNECYKRARAYWQHTGEIVSGRLAEACLNGKESSASQSLSKDVLRARLAQFSGGNVSDVNLFPTGMAAIAAIQRAVQMASPGRATAQIGFPYVDTQKIQENLGNGCVFFAANGSAADVQREMNQLEAAASKGLIGAIYSEFPANPLLIVPPLERLWEISLRYEVPLIVDETLATSVNVKVLPYATAIVTSLTKFFSGEGDVAGGSVVWNPQHPAYDRLRSRWNECSDDQLFEGDAVVLEKNSIDFAERMKRINSNTAELVGYLREHPAIESVHYPNQEGRQRDLYDMYRVESGGCGGLFSMKLKGGEPVAAKFYDSLFISKGPSLGTNFSIACPYTLLAHFLELPRVAPYGVTPDLIRVSVGLEDPTDLIARFERSLSTGKTGAI